MLKKYLAIMMVLTVAGTAVAFADEWRGGHSDRHGYANQIVVYRKLPTRHTRVIVRGVPYFYGGGVFYQPVRGGYVIVTPPREAFVRVLPRGAVVVYRNQVPFYRHHDVYYTATPRGYVICR